MTEKYINTNVPGYVKDTQTGAVINKNVGELTAFEAARARSKRQNEQEQRLADLETDIGEIKSLLLKLLESK